MARSLSLIALVAAASSLLGCGESAAPSGPYIAFDACQPLILVPDPSATAAEVAGLAAGLALWNASAGTTLSVAAPGDPSAPASATPSASASTEASASADASAPASAEASAPATLPIHFQQAADLFHGLYDAPNAQIYINTDLADHELAVVITHEVGHAFGLVHIPVSVGPSVMNPANLMIEPQPRDIDTLEAKWGRCQ